MDRGFEIKDMLVGNETPDEIMDLIRDTFESVLVPEVGGYYTFVYSPTTPDIQYDQYPLVAVTELFSWGFRGINYHWGDTGTMDGVRSVQTLFTKSLLWR